MDKWIPCSERLPEVKPNIGINVDYYLTCSGDGCINILMYYHGWNCCPMANGNVLRKNEIDGIVAWMPLPEPYKGDSND